MLFDRSPKPKLSICPLEEGPTSIKVIRFLPKPQTAVFIPPHFRSKRSLAFRSVAVETGGLVGPIGVEETNDFVCSRNDTKLRHSYLIDPRVSSVTLSA